MATKSKNSKSTTTKKPIKVADLKPSKDAKGGVRRPDAAKKALF